MSLWGKIEPITIKFKREILNSNPNRQRSSNTSNIKQKHTLSKDKLHQEIYECIEVKKLSFSETVIEVGVSPTTVRRVCRTLKIGRYSDQIPFELRSNSSQQPYGWKSVNGVLEKEPSEWRCVKMMFQLREQGLSLHKIASELTHRGIPTKNGGRWFAKSISQIIKFNEKFISIDKTKEKTK